MPEFTVVQTDLVQDYMDFINALDYKFAFEDKDKFEDDFILLMNEINPNGTYDAGSVFEHFVKLINKHSSIKNLEDNVDFAVAELKALGKNYGE